MSEYFKDNVITKEEYRLLLTYKIFDFTKNIEKNSEFRLVRYTQVQDVFEV